MTKPIQIKNLTIGSGIPKICVPLTGTTREKICQEAEAAKKRQQIWWNGVQIFFRDCLT